MKPAEIRTASAADVEDVLELWAVTRSKHASTADTPQAVSRLMADRPDSLFVAEMDGRIVGTLIAASDGWQGNMYRLAVEPDAQRRGIGRALVREGERRLRKRGTPRITALVAHADEAATGFWVAAGYAADAEIGRRRCASVTQTP